MMTPLIGITTYPKDERGYIKLSARYAEAVRRAGGIPLLLQPGETHLDELLALLDGLILSGGGDMNPTLYTTEQNAHIYLVNDERDQFEMALTRSALSLDKPLFCICRGLQVLNVALGGTLIPHIPDEVENPVEHRQPPRDPILHDVSLDADSRLASILEHEQVSVASWHHQAIKQLAPALSVVARAPDGVIEAVEMPDKPTLLAVQWHPEITAKEDPIQQKLFDELVHLASKQKG